MKERGTLAKGGEPYCQLWSRRMPNHALHPRAEVWKGGEKEKKEEDSPKGMVIFKGVVKECNEGLVTRTS